MNVTINFIFLTEAENHIFLNSEKLQVSVILDSLLSYRFD
jgi:hypothetical protein